MSSIQVLKMEQSWVQKTPTICGGDACIRDTRIPVWAVVAARRLGALERELVNYFVTPLSSADIQAALTYYEQHPEEIDETMRQNEEA